jgi:hypothetical protein
LHVLPGSFNPPHDGHARMMSAALLTPAQQQSQRTLSDHLCLFELSVANVDKPPPSLHAIAQRIKRCFAPDSTLRRSALLITRSPTFVEKSAVIHPHLRISPLLSTRDHPPDFLTTVVLTRAPRSCCTAPAPL